VLSRGYLTIAKVVLNINRTPHWFQNVNKLRINIGFQQCKSLNYSFENGVPNKTNFDKYRMIRHREAPKKIEVHFVDSTEDPTGLGEPFFPPVFAALANSLYKATGKRYYEQPFAPQLEMQNLKM
jgi:hypothetical protein